ncbi:MAG TPA: methyltransferase domain-containing protein [Candidatus Dormibacteraeota bacterium]|nr:methyltransferase domain-containing protein [Candidatus Dormibacteraeota bacterium]
MKHISNHTTVQDLVDQTPVFAADLWKLKTSIATKEHWYPYDILGNLIHLNSFVPKELSDFNKLASNRVICDIGAADGDFAFLLAKNGFNVDVIDWPQTNWNGMSGVKSLTKYFRPRVHVYEVDLNNQFDLPHKKYDLVLFLGILYHLENPYYVLRKLSGYSTYLFLSTRIARETDDGKVRLNDAPVAYLVDSDESNNDPTNYWMFSLSGLTRLIKRTGWEIVAETTVGRTNGDSTPSNPNRDERAFFMLKSLKNRHADSGIRSPFVT